MKYTVTIIIASLILAVVLAAVLAFPQYQKLRNERVILYQKKDDLQSHRDYQAKLETVRNQLRQREELMAKVISALPDEADVPSFLNFLQKASEASGVSIERLGWSEAAPPRGRDAAEERIKEHNLVITFSGSYYAFKNFLYAMESSARLIDIARISFQAKDSETEPIQFKVDLKIRSY